jgi:two-component system phosphate regulon response regulator PhoB
MAHRILIIEDEDDIRDVLEYDLVREGFEVETAGNGEDGLRIALSGKINLVLLDLMLPGVDGLEVCRRLRGLPLTKDLPIVMVTAKGEEADIVRGLETGADDYVTKPFLPAVLVARIRTVLRRRRLPPPAPAEDIRVHDALISPAKREVKVKGRSVDLTYTEFAILQFLAAQPGRVFTRDQIVDGVRGGEYPVTDRSVDVHIVALRKKLGAAAAYVETVRGVGYRFRE